MTFEVSFFDCRDDVVPTAKNFTFEPESEKIYNIVIGGFGTEAQMSYVSFSCFINKLCKKSTFAFLPCRNFKNIKIKLKKCKNYTCWLVVCKQYIILNHVLSEKKCISEANC